MGKRIRKTVSSAASTPLHPTAVAALAVLAASGTDPDAAGCRGWPGRASAAGTLSRPGAGSRCEPGGGTASDAIVGERRVYWARGSAAEPTPIYDRARLQPGHRIVGPAVVEQLDATTLIGPGQHARLDEYRNLHIDLDPISG
jgi:hypothetical protein